MSASGVYRALAGVVAGRIGQRPEVVSVYARRGVAAGEVSLGRSDIDLSILIDDDANLGPLAAAVRRMRVAAPVLGECLVHTASDLERWSITDPYRASIDRRAALVLHGPQPAFPDHPVTTPAAVRRAAFWIEHHLPRALRMRSRRTLHKIALEIRVAAAVASGELAQPFVGRREAVRRWPLPADRRSLLADCMATLGRLHAELGLALAPSGHDHPAPFTREALDLYVRYVNPFAFDDLPPSLELEPPTATAVAAGQRFYAAEHRLRAPGFTVGALSSATEGLDAALRRPRRPRARSLGDYYGRVYPAATRDAEALWAVLDPETS